MGSRKQDYYELLGVPRNATKDDLKKAYGISAVRLRCDVCGRLAHRRVQVQKASSDVASG
jgi:DnaJ-class molecular chaperone